MQLTIEKVNAIKAYNSGDEATKKLLNDLFGEKTFIQKITDRVKTFEDACEVLGLDGGGFDVDATHDSLNGDVVSMYAYGKLIIIARALNEGWQPDWSNSSQNKYVPWFQHESGFGLSYGGYVDWHSSTAVGSRLCFKSSELAVYAAKQFRDIYNDFLSIK